MDKMDIIKCLFEESIKVKSEFVLDNKNIETVHKIADILIKSLKGGNKILVFGNGGSAADSLHMAAELVVRFESERKALPCISLNTNVSNLTAAGNDYAFSDIFSRQVEALGGEGDVAFGISTSGNSRNVIKALDVAGKTGLGTIALTGRGGGEVSGIADISLTVNSNNTARIQEVHGLVIHILCKLIESEFD